jgi:hypothetical protein
MELVWDPIGLSCVPEASPYDDADAIVVKNETWLE